MLKRLSARLSLITVLLGLTACASVPSGSSKVFDQTNAGGIASKVSLGSLIAVPPGVGIDDKHARVVDEYFAASGRHCIRVQLEQTGSSTRVVCQRESGNWSFTRALLDDEIPADNEEALIKIPVNGVDSDLNESVESDQSSVIDRLGIAFDTQQAHLPALSGESLQTFSATSMEGPVNWTQMALAGAADFSALKRVLGISDMHRGGH